MKHKLLVLSSVLLCLVLSPVVRAVQTSSPLLLLITDRSLYYGDPNDWPSYYGYTGDLWVWSAAGHPLKQLTHYGYNYSPVISPDGKYVVYDSIPQEVVSQKCSIPLFGFTGPPTNVWVLNITTDDGVRIAEQPPGIKFCEDNPGNPPPKYIKHLWPAWSPDSKSLVWVEYQPQEDHPGATDNFIHYRLVTYNLAQKLRRVIVAALPLDQENGHNGGDVAPVDWGQSGIVSFAYAGLYIYDAEGKQLFFGKKFDPGFDACSTLLGVPQARWVKDGDKTYVYFEDCSHPTQVLLVDSLTYQPSEPPGQLEIYNLNAPDQLSLVPTFDDKQNVLWQVLAPGQPGHTLDLKQAGLNGPPISALDRIAISPDGQQVAYLSDNGVMLYDKNGHTTPVDIKPNADQGIAWIGWGPVGLRIRHP